MVAVLTAVFAPKLTRPPIPPMHERAGRARRHLHAQLGLRLQQHVVLIGQRLRAQRLAQGRDDPARVAELRDHERLAAGVGPGHGLLQARRGLGAAGQLQRPVVAAAARGGVGGAHETPNRPRRARSA